MSDDQTRDEISRTLRKFSGWNTETKPSEIGKFHWDPRFKVDPADLLKSDPDPNRYTESVVFPDVHARLFDALDQRDAAIRERDEARQGREIQVAHLRLQRVAKQRELEAMTVEYDRVVATRAALIQALHCGPVFAAARDHAMHGPSEIWGPLVPRLSIAPESAGAFGRQWRDGARLDLLP